jgi:hypothetical protein
VRFSWAVTHRSASLVGAGALAALAFSQGWEIVGAVLAGSAIADVILLAIVARFRWRHRPPGTEPGRTTSGANGDLAE